MSCGGNSYSPEMATWTNASSANPSKWVPFRSIREGFSCSCPNNCNCYQKNPNYYPRENYYNTLAGEWRTFTNVTPANHSVQNKMSNFSEHYTVECHNATPYLPSGSTWLPQKKYQL